MVQHNARKRVLIGLLIMMVGGMLLLKNFGIYENFFDEYIFRWEMIIVSVGLISLLSHENIGPGLMMILIGGGLYARNYVELPANISFWQLFFASMFILAGIFLIFKRKISIDCQNKTGTSSFNNDMIDEVAVFGGGDRTIVSDSFKGGKILAVFGGSNFYLNRSKLAPGKNYIDVLAVFGGLKLIVPEDWNVKISAVSIFGGFSDKHRLKVGEPFNDNETQLIIKGFVIFGGGEINSY